MLKEVTRCEVEAHGLEGHTDNHRKERLHDDVPLAYLVACALEFSMEG